MPDHQNSAARDSCGRFVKGHSGNPGGRPSGRSVMAEIERQLEAEGPDGRPQMARLVEKLISLAIEGDMRAMDLLLRRVAPERVALEANDAPVVYIRDFTGREHERQQVPDAVEEIPALPSGAADGEVIEAEAEMSEDEPEAPSRQPVTLTIARPWENERQVVADIHD